MLQSNTLRQWQKQSCITNDCCNCHCTVRELTPPVRQVVFSPSESNWEFKTASVLSRHSIESRWMSIQMIMQEGLALCTPVYEKVCRTRQAGTSKNYFIFPMLMKQIACIRQDKQHFASSCVYCYCKFRVIHSGNAKLFKAIQLLQLPSPPLQHPLWNCTTLMTSFPPLSQSRPLCCTQPTVPIAQPDSCS